MTQPSKSHDSTGPKLRIRVLDVGGSHVNAAVVEIDNATARVLRRTGAGLDSEQTREIVLRQISAPAVKLGRDGDDDLWGFAFPGPFDYAGGVGQFEGFAKFGSLDGVDIRDELAARLPARRDRLHFLNDADAYGLGEWAFGGASRPARLLCLTLGTGLGSAFIADGTLVHTGRGVPPRGQAFLLTHEGRPIEDFVSSRAIVAQFREATAANATVREIAARARQGGRAARAVIEASMAVLGEVIAPWLDSFDVSEIVIGGSIARSWNLLEPPLRKGIARVDTGLAAATVLRRSTLLDDAPLLGAAEWVNRLTHSSI